MTSVKKDHRHSAGHSKTTPSPSEDGDSKYPKETIEVHKRFDIPRTETCVTYFSCAHKGKVLKPGRLFITQGYICFHAQIFGKHHKKIIPFSEVSDIAKKHYGVFPNAIKITTNKKKELTFASFMHRDDAYDALMHQWYTLKTDVKRGDSDDSDYESERKSGADKKGDAVEMKKVEVTLKASKENAPKKEDKNNKYNNYDISKKTSPSNAPVDNKTSDDRAPTPATKSPTNKPPDNKHADEHANGEHPSSLADRAAALIASGAIVTGDEEGLSRPGSQQVMLQTANEVTSSSSSLQQPGVQPTKAKRDRTCWCF